MVKPILSRTHTSLSSRYSWCGRGQPQPWPPPLVRSNTHAILWALKPLISRSVRRQTIVTEAVATRHSHHWRQHVRLPTHRARAQRATPRRGPAEQHARRGRHGRRGCARGGCGRRHCFTASLPLLLLWLACLCFSCVWVVTLRAAYTAHRLSYGRVLPTLLTQRSTCAHRHQ